MLACASAALALAAIHWPIVLAWLAAALLALIPELMSAIGVSTDPRNPWRAMTASIACAAHGLVSGAAAPLFLSDLPTATGMALTLFACTSAILAALPDGADRPGFRFHAIACLGPFVLAWWLMDGEGKWLAGVSVAGFGLTASVIEHLLHRLTRRCHRLQLERQQLLERLGRCAAIERQSERLVGAACHDLRQPVAAIALVSALLRQKASDPSLEPALAALENGVVAINRQLLRIAGVADELRAVSSRSGQPDPGPGN